MPTDPWSGSRYPASTAAPNVSQDIQNAVNDLADGTVPAFATAAARDTAFTNWKNAGNTAFSGMQAFTQSDGRFWRYSNNSVSGWVYAGGAPGPIVTANAGAGWANVAGRAPGAYMDASSTVHLVGAVAPNTNYNPQDGLTHTALQLPSGYYPAISTTCLINTGRFYVTGAISTGGLLSIIDGSTSSISATTIHYLDGITYHPGYTGSLPYN